MHHQLNNNYEIDESEYNNFIAINSSTDPNEDGIAISPHYNNYNLGAVEEDQNERDNNNNNNNNNNDNNNKLEKSDDLYNKSTEDTNNLFKRGIFFKYN